MKILFTNNDLSLRAGTQLYIRDVAFALQKRGHSPFVYSPTLGDVAGELKAATIPVVNNLASLSVVPDIIHGQHHLETMTALLHFPEVPAVYFCHGWIPWEEAPPKFPRILRYVAVDHACRDRLIYEHGIPEERVRVLLNFVDMERFKPRAPLPPRPRRALLFSNYASKNGYASLVRRACERSGIALDVAGSRSGRPCREPEKLLGNYDLVFAKGRAALEALATGTAVILCDMGKSGQMVTSAEFDALRPVNFGIRARQEPVSLSALLREIGRYNAADAGRVSQKIRETAGLDRVAGEILSIYQEAVKEKDLSGPGDPLVEKRAAAVYLRWLSPALKEAQAFERTPAILLFYHLVLRIPVVGNWLKKSMKKRRLIRIPAAAADPPPPPQTPSVPLVSSRSSSG
ncbi:MAG: glycosyltransferase [Candidatus Omnitrophota bacterium]